MLIVLLVVVVMLLGLGELLYFLYRELGKDLPLRHRPDHHRIAHY
jgi:hypothetical protein